MARTGRVEVAFSRYDTSMSLGGRCRTLCTIFPTEQLIPCFDFPWVFRKAGINKLGKTKRTRKINVGAARRRYS